MNLVVYLPLLGVELRYQTKKAFFNFSKLVNTSIIIYTPGEFERDIFGHDECIINACAIRDNPDGSSILVGGGDDGFLHFWDWKSGYLFQSIAGIPQPGSLASENAIYAMAFDQSRTRLMTCECDKTIKIYKEDANATEKTHPIGNWRQLLNPKKKR